MGLFLGENAQISRDLFILLGISFNSTNLFFLCAGNYYFAIDIGKTLLIAPLNAHGMLIMLHILYHIGLIF